MSKESFIKGTLILSGAALLTRILGIAQRVPLERILDEVGGSSFTISSNIYLLLLTIATAGIPSTLSKMVAERYALNQIAQAKRIYQAACYFGIGTGIIMCFALYFAAPYYAEYSRTPGAVPAIQAIAPALLFFPLIAMMRGNFQGQSQMLPSGISQIVEQILRVFFAIFLAYLLTAWNYDSQHVAAGASFGGVLGGVGALCVMMWFHKKSTLYQDIRPDRSIGLWDIYKSIFKISIPIVLASLVVQMMNFIDTSMTKRLLESQLGEIGALEIVNILGNRAQTIAGIPPMFAIALSQSLLPVISATFARQDFLHLRNQIQLAFRVSLLASLPFILFFSIGSYAINGLLFSSLNGSELIAYCTLSTIFQILVMTSSSILQGMGMPKVPMFSVMIGIAVKLTSIHILTPLIGIYGIVGTSLLTYAVIMGINLYALKKIVPFSIMHKKWSRFLLVLFATSVAAFYVQWLLFSYGPAAPTRLFFFFSTSIIGLVTFVLYALFLYRFRVITDEDLSHYPRSIARIFSIFTRKK